MSIKPWDKYQPNALLPSPQYPYGALRQETDLGVGNGTPLDVDWGNDFEAFKQTAFSRSGLTPSGSPDTVTNSEMFNAVQDSTTRSIWERLAAESGYNLVLGSFEEGGTLVNTDDVLWSKRLNKIFSGPVGTVAAGTNPVVGGFIAVNNDTIRAQLEAPSGSSLIGFYNPSDQELSTQTNIDVYAKRLAASINLAFRDISNFGYTEGMSNALPAIQAAIDSLPARGGAVLLPPHHINIIPVSGKMIELGDGDGGTNFSTKNGIKIIGAGAGFGVSGALVPTILNYNGSATVTTPMISSKGRLSDCAIQGVFLSLNGKCGGISVNSTSGSDYESIKIINPAPNAIALAVIGGLAPTGNYNIFNRFSKISIALLSPNSIGLYMDGNFAAQNDTWISHFELMRIENFAGATGSTIAWFKFVDSCTFRRCHFDNKPEPTSNGVIFDATSNDGFPAGMAFYDCSVHQTAVMEDASHKIRKNYFYGNGTYDNEITPTHPLLCGITDTGKVFGEFLYGEPWKSVVATATAGTGTLTTVSGAVQYQSLGATVNIRGTVFITTNGTGAGFIRVQLPVEVPVANENCFFIGRNTATGGALVGQMAATSNTIFIRKFDDTYPGGNGAQLEFSGVYMVSKV